MNCGHGDLEFSKVVTNCASFSAKFSSPLISQHLLQPVCVFSGGWGCFLFVFLRAWNWNAWCDLDLHDEGLAGYWNWTSGLSWPQVTSCDLHLHSICVWLFGRRFYPKWLYNGEGDTIQAYRWAAEGWPLFKCVNRWFIWCHLFWTLTNQHG